MGTSASKKKGGELNEGVYCSKPDSGAAEDVVEVTVCREDDLENGEMKVYELGQQGSVLLVKEDGTFSALGTKCTHYNAPLIKGVLSNGKIRCPWHGACFNSKTGDIEDFPGLDSLPCYRVRVDGGEVKVSASSHEVGKNKRVKPTSKRTVDDKRTFIVIGGGGAGQTCVETLRQEGFTGRLILISKEPNRPYDRPKLSKALSAKAEDLALRSPDYYQSADIELWLNREVTSIETEKRLLTCSDGTSIQYDAIMIATGGRPRTLDNVDLKNIHYLRSVEDANVIAEKSRKKNVVILGTSFIGMEVAAYLADKANSISIIGSSTVPFLNVLGEDIGKGLQKLLEEHEIKFYNGNGIVEFVGNKGILTEVVLKTGEHIPADICVIGIGVLPSTEFLENTNIKLNSSKQIIVDEYMKTNVDGIFAGGDIVEFPLTVMDARVNIGHWQLAMAHGRCAALNMLNKNEKLLTVPFFWSMLFGKSVRYAAILIF
ncbi:apoptosis-inducing factor 3 isoform X2 [Centruroides vittatus]|uniref:apoptosis-inducing factor 3 isoform X2 n=1 Tax=Centruroides vittatus TaxID=120091 RepID=UPI00350ECD65